MKTRDLQRAAQRLTEMEDRVAGKPRKRIVDALAAFQAQHQGNAPETRRRYVRLLKYFSDFCAANSYDHLDQISVEVMDQYAPQRNQLKSWTKDVELLRQLFEFCRDRGWIATNPAKALRIPRKLEANDVVPYSRDEIMKIIAACSHVGRSSYERRRALAMTLLMRYVGLRISDVVTLSRDHVKDGRIEKRAVKNSKWIRVQLPTSALDALENLPLPIGAAQDNKRYFASDTAKVRSLVKGAWRTMSAVFKRSGVANGHPHRFRHTLASELLGKGGSIEEVASILGDNPATISRYYAKWTPELQAQQDALIRKIHGTHLAQIENQAFTC